MPKPRAVKISTGACWEITRSCSAGAAGRPPYANWPVLRYMLRGNTVSDAPLIIGSLDPCYSCTDRVTLIDINKRKAKTVPYKEIERYGIERTNSPCK
ncbi:Hydrogenase-4 component G [Serratia fonticola]|uniref:Hydrogenase-4 component G n=1 Tax=Serratia fonticola TaxID=47917 RepID=A0A4U9TFH4_SERFO|nr:Hydrogenase-4 component G [Serratia fonticola]